MRAWIALAVLVSLTNAGCGSAVGDPVVNGWPIGPELSCSSGERCPELLATATIGLDQREPGHPAVVKVALHQEGRVFNANGDQVLMTRSGGCCSVARFELADASVRAIGVGYPGVSQVPMAIDYGP